MLRGLLARRCLPIEQVRRLQRYDSIIVGAGHNGLACAARLARGGQRVLVVEAARQPGGLAAPREFHPGFRVSVTHSVGGLSGRVAEALDLAEHGYRSGSPLPIISLGEDGRHVTIDAATANDNEAYRNYANRMQRFADALAPFWLQTIPRIGSRQLSDVLTYAKVGLNLRRLGKDDMREFLRIASLPMRDLMDECVDDDLLKTALAWDGLVGSKMAPRSPNGAVMMALYRLAGRKTAPAATSRAGDSADFVNALAAAAESAGAELRYGSAVKRITIAAGGNGPTSEGVELDGGERIQADRVVSATDPKRTFIDLVGVEHLDIGFTNRIRRLRCDGYVGKLHLALQDLPQFTGLQKPDGRLILAGDLDRIEFAFDAAKYGELPEEPVMEVAVPSLNDESLAPQGRHVLSAHVLYVPAGLAGGWTDAQRETMRERSLDTLERFAPGIRSRVIHAEFLTPADIARDYRVTGGHWHHAEFAFDQMLMMRPTWEAAQYRTPIERLFLCGAGCHPAGDLTGAPGYNAAGEILS